MIGLTRVLPWLVPGLAVAMVVGVLVCRSLGRRLGIRPVLAWGLVVSAGLIVAATLTPLRVAISPGPEPFQWCDLSRTGLASIADLGSDRDVALNIVLFVPLGFVIALLPSSRVKGVVLAIAIASPFAIELIQAAAAPLGRGCQSADVVDNLSGLVIGLCVGATIGWLVGRRG